MSQSALIPTSSVSLPPVTYMSKPVVTTEMLAEAYGCSTDNIRKNFSNNSERFTEGKHYFSITNGELRAFRDCVKDFPAVVPPRTRNLTLWTERGAARHAKMLNTDTAWDVFELLEETFFRTSSPAPAQPLPDATLTPDQQCTLQAIVKGKVEALPEDQRKGKGLYPQLWSRFNNHFRIAKYSQLPQCRMSDAIAYLMQMEINQPKALPAADTVPALPAERRGRHVPGPVERELLAIEEEIRHGFFGMAAQFRETMDRMRSAARPLYSPTYEKLGWHSRIGFSVDGLADGLGGGYWNSLRHMEEAVDDARACARQFVTLARLHGM